MSINHSHLPSWLENNFLFRKAFLLRKLFLTRKRSSHFGQSAEDIAIKRFFNKKKKGFFVDVGCFHPTKYNNTYRFYKNGWRGINIDIDSIKIEGFNIVRPKDTNLVSAISDKPGALSYWTNGFYSPTVTLEETFSKEDARNFKGYIKKTVKANTLSNIIDATKYKNKQIDLLTVDVEGHDYQVLKSLDFSRYQPHLIAVETQLTTLHEVMEENTFKFLSEKGYSIVNWVGMTLIFRR